MNISAQMKRLLDTLEFRCLANSQGTIWRKNYEQHHCNIEVDFGEERIHYPTQMKTHDRTTSNFSKPENLVVLECVDRLLSKGYPPEKIELEKKWPLGRRTKGKLDILVKKQNTEDAFLMIECKTYGHEFEIEIRNMLEKEGGQLFSYWQQDRSADLLCLYASKVSNGQMEYTSNIVVIDVQMRNTGTVKDAYNRWNKQFLQKGLFEPDVHAYRVKFTPLRRNDLKPLGSEDGKRIFHQFLEILRHNIVSDKGNAFNKIFNLFLCKILDEDRHGNEELEFQWIEGRDTEESLLGRLNGLYKNGMSRYLDKEVTDYSPEEFNGELLSEQIKTIINELRLYKNQEFAFVDVFNRESFTQNARIVVEVVKLLQGWQIRYTHKQQFLGEFFELLLSAGFKQETGQFFTPVPLTRFILRCLPIESIINHKLESRDMHFLPNIIDFACGSGHFLTEAMDIVQELVENVEEKDVIPTQVSRLRSFKQDKFGWAGDYVFGIEWDYRLAKTSKLAAFLNGDGNARIIHASGLEPFSSYPDEIRMNSFDILVANPPYAVKGFKQTVTDGFNSFALYDKLTDRSGEIEVLFVERMAQLVKAGGVAGIILPRSILNNTGVYSEARKTIFENFTILGIVILAGNAFMAPGINTTIFFLRKRKNRLHLDSPGSYREMCRLDTLETGGVVLVKSGEKDVEKRFLGYEFSSRRGSEGIKIREETLLFDDNDLFSDQYVNSYILRAMLGRTIDHISERLREHLEIVALERLIDWERGNAIGFIDRYSLLHDDEGKLVDLGDYIATLETGSRPKGGVSEFSDGIPSLGGEHIDADNGTIDMTQMKFVPKSFWENMKTGHAKEGDILICKDGAQTGKCARLKDDENPYCVNEHVFIVRSKQSELNAQYLHYFMMSSFFQKQVKMYAFNKKGQAGLTRGHIKRIQLFLPSLHDQERIVQTIDKKWDALAGKNKRARFIDGVLAEEGLSGEE
ncbi:MAG: N-6 DNA methylase [Chloroflexota bacterium]|nr:N-6 DNA methylase [Chloroflexota bacterium]MDE2949012.1 N-6 DNA methylase [Chloroflexota bacterium]